MPPACPPPAAYRASVLHFSEPPPSGVPADFLSSPPPHEYFEDGCLLIAGGKVVATGGGVEVLSWHGCSCDTFYRTMEFEIHGGVERKARS
jgi:hypothetical protein